MRGKRSKQYRKLMHAYQLTFDFREPYQVLLDSGIIRSGSRFKMQLGKMLTNTLHGEIKPMITQCCIRHLYTSEAKTDEEKREKEAWIEVAKQAERRRCGHHELENPLSELECIMSVVDPKGSGRNRHRYCVASQEVEVREALRRVAGVPLVYINRSVMILEPMASTSADVREADERGKRRAGLLGRRGPEPTAATGAKRKRDEDDDDSESDGGVKLNGDGKMNGGTEAQQQQQPKKKKPKGPKAPNPLSVKKKKPENGKPQQKTATTTVAKQTEDERAAIHKATKKDPQASEKALDASTAVTADGMTDGAPKRKRKRKPKDAAAAATGDDTTGGVEVEA